MAAFSLAITVLGANWRNFRAPGLIGRAKAAVHGRGSLGEVERAFRSIDPAAGLHRIAGSHRRPEPDVVEPGVRRPAGRFAQKNARRLREDLAEDHAGNHGVAREVPVQEELVAPHSVMPDGLAFVLGDVVEEQHVVSMG